LGSRAHSLRAWLAIILREIAARRPWTGCRGAAVGIGGFRLARSPLASLSAGRDELYASQQSYGLNPPTSTFTATGPTACDANSVVSGNLVKASYPFSYLTSYFFKQASLTLKAQSCYPG
jgi:hypothetical protein